MPTKKIIQFLNQGISRPVGIVTIVSCLIIAGGILSWQFWEFQQEIHRLALE